MDFFGIGLPELLFIGVLALIVFGPEKLPELMGQFGRLVREVRRATSDVQTEFQRAINLELEEQSRSASLGEVPAPSTARTSSSTPAPTSGVAGDATVAAPAGPDADSGGTPSPSPGYEWHFDGSGDSGTNGKVHPPQSSGTASAHPRTSEYTDLEPPY